MSPAARIRIGCDGWLGVRGRGLHRPPAAARGDAALAAYAARFDAVELPARGEELPEATRVAAWRAAVPEHFRFMVGVSRSVTHGRRLRDCDATLARLGARLRPLGACLGGLLFTLPRQGRADARRLAELLARRGGEVAWFFDVGAGPWAAGPVVEAILTGGGHLVQDLPPQPRAGEERGGPGAPPAPVYARLRAGAALPSFALLRDWASRAQACAARGAEVTIICERHSLGQGLEPARRLRLVLEEQRADGALETALR